MAKWIIDPDHSVAAFAIKHMMIANVRGQFNDITGKVYFEPADIAHSSVELEVGVASVNTGIKKRDEHLLSSDFFDAAKYPKITFRSTAVEVSGANRAIVTGDLTIHGITRTAGLSVEYAGPVKDPLGDGKSMGFSASTIINREDYGMTWNEPMEKGGLMLGREAELTIDIEADLAE